jgi:hypothetical protein
MYVVVHRDEPNIIASAKKKTNIIAPTTIDRRLTQRVSMHGTKHPLPVQYT